MMASVEICGIKNCDTMKKAFAWLDLREIPYVFRDYKKSGADAVLLEKAIARLGWENVLNRKGTTWRALPGEVRETMNEAMALKVALENPSLIRRPLLVLDGAFHLGFDEKNYAALFSQG